GNIRAQSNYFQAYKQARSKYLLAEAPLQRALMIQRKKLRPQHQSTATTLGNLGSLYQAQGEYNKAFPLLQRAVKISEEELGPQHPGTAESLNNLAMLYHKQRRYSDAEP